MLCICTGDDDRGLKMAGNDMRVNCYGATPVSQYKVMWGEIQSMQIDLLTLKSTHDLLNMYIYYILSLFLAHYCILRVILLLSDYEANFGVNIFFYQSVQVIFYLYTRSITLKNA